MSVNRVSYKETVEQDLHASEEVPGAAAGAPAVPAAGTPAAEAPLAPVKPVKPPEPEVVASPELAEAAEAAREAGGTLTGGGKTLTIPHSAMKAVKEKERVKALESLAKEMGYASVDEMRSRGKASARVTEPEPEPEVEQDPEAERPDPNATQLQQLQAERDALTKKLGAESRAARRAQEKLDAMQVEMEWREQLGGAGVQGGRKMKLAMHLMQDHLDTLDDAGLAAFKESEFIAGLKKSDPYLFNETVTPATTGPGNGAPPPPAPGAAAAANAAGDKIDCSKMSREEFQRYLRTKKISGQDYVTDKRGMEG